MTSPDPEYLDGFLDQEKVWMTRDGFIQIDDMETVHRRNAAGFLLKKAGPITILALVARDEEPTTKEIFEVVGSPHNWIKRTPLYRRLIQGGADPAKWFGDE